MTMAPHYQPADTETALKYAVQHFDGRGARVQLVEGELDIMVPTWDHERLADQVRSRLDARARELGCITGSGNLDLPGSANWYVPDLAVVPDGAARGAGALPASAALLVVEVTSESNADTDRGVKRRRYGQSMVPLYLLVDRMRGSWTLYAEPTGDGYAVEDGPHPFGDPVRMPAPFGLTMDTGDW